MTDHIPTDTNGNPLTPIGTDENGNPIYPPQKFSHYGQIVHLVPDAKLSTRGYKITEWFDERPQPTYEEINAVSLEDAELALLPPSEDLLNDADIVLQAIMDASPGLRVKVLQELRGKRGK